MEPYENERHVAAGRADGLFRWLSNEGDLHDEDTGSVDSPTGHIARIRVDGEDIARYVSEFGDPWVSESRNVEPGYYLITTTDLGVVWAHYYGPAESTQDLANQIRDFRELQRRDAEYWSD